MTLDEHFRDQISRGQPPLVALHNAASAYAESLQEQGDPKTRRPVVVSAGCRTTLYVRYDELEDTLHSLGRRKCTLRYFDGIVRIVVEPEDAEIQSDKLAESAQYADETAAWSEPQDTQELESWRWLEKGELVQLGDETDRCANPWKDPAKWEPVSELSVGQEAPDPSYPSHRIFRRRIKPVVPKPQDSEAVELLREARTLLEAASDRPIYTSDETDWIERVRKFLEGKQ